jgi:ketosteroid isomerase-like protein
MALALRSRRTAHELARARQGGQTVMKILSSLMLLIALATPRSWAAQAAVSPERELTALENDWSQAAVKRDGVALQRFYADEYIFTDENGVVSNKAKDIADLTSGAFRLTSYKFEDMKVRIYGDVAVVTGRNTIAGTWEDIKRDISGPYRFTDVFVKRNGRWQCVASQSSSVTEKK